MTRTYRMYVDQGISDRAMYYLRKELPTHYFWGSGRYKATNFVRGFINNSYFDFELNFVLDGTELNYGDTYHAENPEDVERYYLAYTSSLVSEITYIQIQSELIYDSGRPYLLQRHQYDILELIPNTKTHKYNILEVITNTKTHQYNIEN